MNRRGTQPSHGDHGEDRKRCSNDPIGSVGRPAHRGGGGPRAHGHGYEGEFERGTSRVGYLQPRGDAPVLGFRGDLEGHDGKGCVDETDAQANEKPAEQGHPHRN